jgi:hypothetical protein
MNSKMEYPAFIKTMDLWLGAANVPFRHMTDDEGHDM